MDKKPIPDRIDRIEERIDEIKRELAELGDESQTIEPEDSAEQAEVIARVTDLRDEERLLKERLVDLKTRGAVDNPS